MKVGVIGCGYVGLITAVGLALKGHNVTAVEIDPIRVEKITKGIVPFYEPGLKNNLKKCLNKKNLKIANSLEDTNQNEIIFICVQTPPKKNGAINLKILESACKGLANILKNTKKSKVIVVRSTVIPGTTDNFVSPIFKDSKVDVAINPEFLREGSALADFLQPDRIVVGTHSKKAKKLLLKLYKVFDAPIITTTPSTAELSKYASNTLLATLVSFSNEIARFCERTKGADVEEVLGIVHKDRRFKLSANRVSTAGIISYLKAGCGFGGSCLPKDLSALISYAKTLGEKTPLLKAVSTINNSQSVRVVNMASNIIGGLKNRKVSVLGVAFKGGTDDLRHSPGLRIVEELLKQKTKITIFDPLVESAALKQYRNKGVFIASSLTSALKGADVCIIASNAQEFNHLNSSGKLFGRTIILDGRRILKIPTSKEDRYYGVGRYINNHPIKLGL